MLVWQLSKAHTTLNVTCIAKSFFPSFHVQYGGDDQKELSLGDGGGTICLLGWKQQQYRPSDPHEVLLRIVLSLIPQRRQICIRPFENVPVAERDKDFKKQPLNRVRGIPFFLFFPSKIN